MHQPDGHFLGIAVVSVDTQVDAERLRVEYNGKVIDHSEFDGPVSDRFYWWLTGTRLSTICASHTSSGPQISVV